MSSLTMQSEEITPDHMVSLCQENGWEYKVENTTGQLVLKTCPYCKDNKSHFYVGLNKELLPYHCFKCDAKGNFYTLRKSFGSSYRPQMSAPKNSVSSVGKMFKVGHKPAYKTYNVSWLEPFENALWHDKHGALTALKERGLTEDTIRHWRIGVTDTYNGKSVVPSWVIPTVRNGKVALVKYRSVPPNPKKMYREAGMESVLFGIGDLDDTQNRVIVTEGELDAISVYQAGHRNVVSVPTGAKSINSDWIDILSGFDEVVILYDQDKAGVDGRNELRKRLGHDKCCIVELPDGMDCNAVLSQEAGEEKLRMLIDDAVLPEVEGLSSASDELLDLQADLAMGEDIDGDGLSWMFPQLQQTVGCVPSGCFVVVTGQAGTGKTTLMKQQFLEWALSGEPCFIWCGEMTPKQLIIQLVQCVCGVERRDITPENVEHVYDQLKDAPLYFGHTGLTPTIDAVLEMATSCRKRYGCKIVLIDNLMTLTQGSRETIALQSQISVKCKHWCQFYNGNVFLVAHPRKAQEGSVESRDSVAGSSDTTNLADVAITVWRKDNSPKTADAMMNMQTVDTMLDRKTSVMCLKNRWHTGGGVAWLYNEGEYSRFREATPNDFEERRSNGGYLNYNT